MSMTFLVVQAATVVVPTPEAVPASSSPEPQGLLSMLPMLLMFAGVFYFLLLRPQQKRVKAHQKLLNELVIGDEVVTTGGIAGTVQELSPEFIVLMVAPGVQLKFQKAAIASVLPKGTLQAAK